MTIGVTTGDADEDVPQHMFWEQLEIIGSNSLAMGEFTEMLELFFPDDIAPETDRVIGLKYP